jgi:hypothetical protein
MLLTLNWVQISHDKGVIFELTFVTTMSISFGYDFRLI